MPTVVLGNVAPVEASKPDESTDQVVITPRPDLGHTETIFSVAEHLQMGAALTLVSSVFASHHSEEDPAWVESDDPVLAQALAQQFECPVGRPDDWREEVEVEPEGDDEDEDEDETP